MLSLLSIKNYVIIDQAEIRFAPGLNMITGETGAGKSILLGAMGLILGRRADTQVLFTPGAKAVIEAVFLDSEEKAASLLKEHDLDAGREIVLRREIAPNGRSRAFVNDSPVTLDTMEEIGASLVNMHQQFETLEIQQTSEQYQVLDAYCGIGVQTRQYQNDFDRYARLSLQLAALREQEVTALKEKDYLNFQLTEFDALQLDPGGIAAMEDEFRLQSGAEEIKSALGELSEFLSGEYGMSDKMRNHIRVLGKLDHGNSSLGGFAQKLQAVLDECHDLDKAITLFEEKLDPDPKRKQQLEERLNIINRMMIKHGAHDENALLHKRQELLNQLARWTNLDKEIAAGEHEFNALSKSLEAQANEISVLRRANAPRLSEIVTTGLQELAMKHAELKIDVSASKEIHRFGKDNVEFLFAANLGSEAKAIRKVASGGELSRLNLCLKSAVSEQMQFPTLVFDEIDAGVSGEVAIRMGQKLKKLSRDHQVIMITHSPQIAAQAGHHLQVSKIEAHGKSIATVNTLRMEERVTEIAKMLSGDPPTKAAILNAKTLIET